MSERLVNALRAEFGEAILDTDDHCGDHHVTVTPERLTDVLGHLKLREGCEMLGDVVGVDHPDRAERFDVIWFESAHDATR